MRQLFLSIFVFIVLGMVSQPIGYQYGKVITINSTVVSGTVNLIDFPFLFKVTDSDLRTTANGGFVTNANGYDIVFTDATCGNNLRHEVERYNPSTGELICWVNIPVLSYSVNTIIHIYYGNSTITVPTSTNTTWSSDHDCVLHLGNNPASSAPQMLDSTPAPSSGTCLGSMTSTNSVTGKIGSAVLFDEVDDGIEISDFDYTQSFTISFWFNLSEVNGTVYQYLFSHGAFTSTNSANIYIGEDNTSFTADQKMLKNIFQDSNDATSTSGLDATNVYINGFWHYYTFVVGNSGGATVYVDGIQKAYISYLGGNTYNPLTNIFLGCRNDLSSTRFLGGMMDEFRILNVPRSADWIATEYSNQNSPGNYYSVGAQTTASIQCIILPVELGSFTAKANENSVLLNWETFSEKNNQMFCVERCANGIDFMEITRLNGALNSNKIIKYQYIDHSPLPGENYYRLKQVDVDGSSKYSPIVCARLGSTVPRLTVYPNPNNGKFTLHLERGSNFSNALVKVVDENGKLVFSRVISLSDTESKAELDLSELEKGSYLLLVDRPDMDPIKIMMTE